MFDLSPEKFFVLLAIGLVVLGPDKLPAAARALASGLSRARRLALVLSEPVHSALAEPQRVLGDAVAEVRSAVTAPVGTTEPTPSPVDADVWLIKPTTDGQPGPVADLPADPSLN